MKIDEFRTDRVDSDYDIPYHPTIENVIILVEISIIDIMTPQP